MVRTVGARLMVALLGAAIFATTALPATASTPSTALVYGDSLTFESRYVIASEISKYPGWTVATHAFGGTAPCDWIAWLTNDLPAYHPSIFAIETVGNWARPCMVDTNGIALVPGSAAFYARIDADLRTIFETVTAYGARVIFIKGPPMLDAAWNARVTKINAIAVSIAKSVPNVSVTGVPRASVSQNGKYTTYKSCLSTETAAMGCTGGMIPVRTVSGVQMGIHFCPTGLQPGYACDVYSSGEQRFGAAVAKGLVKPPAPLFR